VAAATGNEVLAGTSTSTVLVDKDAAVAAAAQKVAVEEKLCAEAAKAVAAESKQRRDTINMEIDAERNPEAIAIGEAQKRAAGEVVEDRLPATAAPGSKKRSADAGILEQARRKKIARLTEICDHLLERGVLVYESTREQLAIDVRERRGEFEKKDEDKDKATATAVVGTEAEKHAAGAGADAPKAAQTPDAKSAPAVLVYTNKRFASTGKADCGGLLGLLNPGDAAEGVVDPEAKGAAASAGEKWQFRWEATPGETHGPFDSMSMHGWMTQGCFSEERRAEVRQCDDANLAIEQCWHPMMEVNFALYM